MRRDLLLILLLVSTTCRLLQTDSIEGTLRIKKNKHSTIIEQKILKVQSAINSPQLANIVYQTIQVVIPSPEHACTAVSLPDNFQLSTPTLPLYYLISGTKGECSYARKVEQAKKGLAKGVIIIDGNSGINNLKRLQEKDPFVVLLISEEDGKLVSSSPDFVAELNMASQSKTRKNEIQIWVSSLNADSYRMLHEWKDVLEQVTSLDKNVAWVVRFAYYSCSSRECSSGFASSCACGGDFCSPQQHGATSNVLVRQDIRQSLIFKDSPALFLKYSKKFFKDCFQDYSKTQYVEDCASTVMHALDIDIKINRQIDSFLTTCESDQDLNFELYKAMTLDRAKYTQIGHYPTFILNHQQIEFRNKEELRNALCRRVGIEQDEACGVMTETTTVFSTIVSGFFYFLLFVLVIGAGGFVVVFFRNRLRRDMNKELKMQVSTAVEHYFTLSETHHT